MGNSKDLKKRMKNKFRKMSIQNQHIVSTKEKNIVWESRKGICLVFQDNELTLRKNIYSNEVIDISEDMLEMFADFTKIWLENEYLWKKIYSLKQAKQGKIDNLNAKLDKLGDYSNKELASENVLLDKYIREQEEQISKLKDKIYQLNGQIKGYKKFVEII